MQQAESNMRTISVIIVAALIGCNGSGTGSGDDDAADAATGDGSDSIDPDAGVSQLDASMMSYAPCDTCCDPIAQDCPNSQGCFENTQLDATYCSAPGTHPAGIFCATDADCIAGTECLQLGFNQCRAFCRSNADCAATPLTPTCVLYAVPASRNAYGICF